MPLDNLAGTDTERAPDDLRGELESAWAVEETGGEVSQSGTDLHVPAELTNDGVSSGEVGEVHQGDARARAADGKFTKAKEGNASAQAAPEKVAAADTNSPSTDTPAKAIDTAAQPAAAAPPAGWTAAEKAEFANLSPALQGAVSRREAEMARGGQQWSEEKRGLTALVDPIAQEARALGLSPQQGVQELLSAHRRLRADPAGFIRDLAARAGLNLATIAGQQPAEGSSDTNPNQPDISALVRAHVEPLLAPIRQQREYEQRQKEDQTVETVTQFATSPGHEHFDAVQTELMALIPAIKGQNPGWSHEKVLQDAYDRAVYANPTTRAAITTAARDAEATRLRVEATARADKARRAGSSVVGGPSGSASSAPKDSIRGELEAAFSGSN